MGRVPRRTDQPRGGDALMKRFGVGEPKSEEQQQPNAIPFRIQDYTQSAAQIQATARQLTEFLGVLDRTMSSSRLAQFSAQVGLVVQQAQAGGKEVVDYAFWKGILLVVTLMVSAPMSTIRVHHFPRPGNTQN